jgi:hypothetical protein
VVRHDATTLRKSNYAEEGSSSPYVSVPGSATEAALTEFPTDVPTTVDYVPEQAAPAFHDGTEWRSLRAASEAFTPSGNTE